MTLEIAASVGGQRFNDGAWVTQYAVAFANLYRSALQAFESGDMSSVPKPWRISFEPLSEATGYSFKTCCLA